MGWDSSQRNVISDVTTKTPNDVREGRYAMYTVKKIEDMTIDK